MARSKFSGVTLPVQLLEKIRKRIKGTGFTSASSFVEYVMRTIVEEKAEKGRAYSEGDKRRVMKRLEALGYF